MPELLARYSLTLSNHTCALTLPVLIGVQGKGAVERARACAGAGDAGDGKVRVGRAQLVWIRVKWSDLC